jgi:hypothetical protein
LAHTFTVDRALKDLLSKNLRICSKSNPRSLAGKNFDFLPFLAFFEQILHMPSKFVKKQEKMGLFFEVNAPKSLKIGVLFTL